MYFVAVTSRPLLSIAELGALLRPFLPAEVESFGSVFQPDARDGDAVFAVWTIYASFSWLWYQTQKRTQMRTKTTMKRTRKTISPSPRTPSVS